MKDLIKATREYREKMLNDPYRPLYHFAIPDDCGIPGDSNGAFYADGVYHLMYLYKNSNTEAFHWGHISSIDLLHWKQHEDAIASYEGDEGCFSGGAFVDEDKTAYISFWKFPSKDFKKDNGGVAIAYSKPPYEKWERIEPIAIESRADAWGVADIEVDGKIRHIACADPSNIWKANGFYYMQAGNKPVLDRYGRGEDSDEFYRGDWTDLFRSKDLKKWELVNRFYVNPRNNEKWPDESEDDMCPSFLPLFDAEENGNETGKWLQLFISHNKGCQYYIGRFEDERFIPEQHGRMSWNDCAYFAPEALIDDKNRHIIWTWLRDNMEDDFKKYGWSGVFAFPRNVWLENNTLRMAPAKEIDLLMYNQQKPMPEKDMSIKVNNPSLYRLKAEIKTDSDKSGFIICADEESDIHTDIYYDKEKQLLVFDARKSGKYGWKIKEEAPLVIDADENLMIDLFVDKSVVEVYANKKQAICRRIYPENPKRATGVKFIGRRESLLSLDVWDMSPANPY